MKLNCVVLYWLARIGLTMAAPQQIESSSSETSPNSSTSSIMLFKIAEHGLLPPAGSFNESAVFLLSARGTQSYSCNGTHFSPSSKPSALLFDPYRNVEVGDHYVSQQPDASNASVAFRLYSDMSFLLVHTWKRAPSPTGPLDIPWLLLNQSSVSPGNGAMTRVSHIVRMNTTGGIKPPISLCTNETNGTSVPVDYSTFYVFFLRT